MAASPPRHFNCEMRRGPTGQRPSQRSLRHIHRLKDTTVSPMTPAFVAACDMVGSTSTFYIRLGSIDAACSLFMRRVFAVAPLGSANSNGSGGSKYLKKKKRLKVEVYRPFRPKNSGVISARPPFQKACLCKPQRLWARLLEFSSWQHG